MLRDGWRISRALTAWQGILQPRDSLTFGTAILASVLAVIFNSNHEILLIRRPGGLQSGTSVPGRPGQWSVPGGKIRDGECPEEAVVREVREEVGLAVVPIRQLADFGDQFYYHCALTEEMRVRPSLRECSD